MKNIFKNFVNPLLICSIVLLTSCEAEKGLEKRSSLVEKSNSKISFEEFKKETGLINFKKTIKIAGQNNSFAKNADGTYELSDFDIDTEIIKRLQLGNNITYSFRIYPKVIVSPNSFYNLTLSNRDGQWIQDVIELKPTLENFDILLGGSTNDIDGHVSLLFTSNTSSLTTTDNCYSVGIVGNNCSNNEISDACVSKKYSTFCFDNQNNLTLGQESDINNQNNSTTTDYSFILNTNNLKENLNSFAAKNVVLGNQILMLLDNEGELNFDQFPYAQLESSGNEEDFKQALANTGMVNYEQIVELLKRQNQNAAEFLANNKDFNVLKPETINVITTDAINTAILDNPITFPLPAVTYNELRVVPCGEQYAMDREDCANTALIQWGALALGCMFGTPILCAIGGVAILAQAAQCSLAAKRDYKICMQ